MRVPAIILLCLPSFGAFGQTIPANVTFRLFFGAQIAFQRPVFIAEIPGRDSHYVVLEQWRGVAAVGRRAGNAWVKDTLALVQTISTQNEMGLLGLAFHPGYTTNRKFYLFY